MIDSSIDVQKWIDTAAGDVDEIGHALQVLSGERPDDSLENCGLANLDAPGVAEYLRGLGRRLEATANRLGHLATHADLTALAESLKTSNTGAPPTP